MRVPENGRRPGQRVLLGLLLLARFRAEGLAFFDGGVPQIVTSLAPLLVLPLVVLLMVAVSGGPLRDMAELLAVIDALLVQLVVSEGLARRWRREADWGLYAVAFNWGQWAVPVVGLLLMVGVRVLVGTGAPVAAALGAAILATGAYALALQWFIAREALRLASGRAALLVLIVNVCTAAVVILPGRLLGLSPA